MEWRLSTFLNALQILGPDIYVYVCVSYRGLPRCEIPRCSWYRCGGGVGLWPQLQLYECTHISHSHPLVLATVRQLPCTLACWQGRPASGHIRWAPLSLYAEHPLVRFVWCLSLRELTSQIVCPILVQQKQPSISGPAESSSALAGFCGHSTNRYGSASSFVRFGNVHREFVIQCGHDSSSHKRRTASSKLA